MTEPTRPLRVLEELGAELERAIERGRPRRRSRRTVVVAAVVIGVLFIPTVVIGTDRWLFSADHPNLDELIGRARTPADVVPAPETLTIEAARPDPGGGAPWAVMVFRSRTGLTCWRPGQQVAGQVGQVRGDGSFRRYGLEHGAACNDLTKPPGVATFIATLSDLPITRQREPARTVVSGVAGPEVTRVSVVGPGRRDEVELSRRGAFLLVLEGVVPRLKVETRYRDGSRRLVP